MQSLIQRDQVLELVLSELGGVLAASEAAEGALAEESTKLMGSQAPLDSVGLVTLLLSIERGIESRTGTRLEIADGHAMSRRPSPFRSAGALADYVTEQVNAKAGAKA